MLKAILIDDEQENINALQIKLQMVCPEVQVVATFTNPTEVIVYLNENSVDILFLDVEMPVLTGFQLLDALPVKNYEVIMVTAYAEYALKAIKASALDYLLKPVEYDELRKAVNKVIVKQQFMQHHISQSIKQNHTATNNEKIMLPSAKDATLVALQDIVWISGENNYSTFHLKDGNKILVTKTLKDYETSLPAQYFFRIHKSYSINIQHLVKLLKTEMLCVQLTDNTKLEVSLRRKAELLQLIDEFVVK